jgi:hypothetical protein
VAGKESERLPVFGVGARAQAVMDSPGTRDVQVVDKEREDMEVVIGILVGEADEETALRLVETGSKCPYCACFTQSEGTIVALYAIPKEQRWWLKWVEKKPTATLGLREAEIFFPRAIAASSPWSREEVEAVSDRAPCGAMCLECTMYQGLCPGCPATRYFLGD